MNCRTLKEKWTEAICEFVRWMKIIMICMVGITLFAMGICLSMTMRENKELKTKIEYMENSKKEDREENAKYIVVMDEITGEVVYAYYK